MIPVGVPFYVVHLYDHTGYYGSAKGLTPEEAQGQAHARGKNVKGLVACSLPFPGTWVGPMPDVSLPAEFREALAHLDRGEEEQ